MQKKKIAVVLLNLGAPDSLQAVKPFLFNLFNDPAIIPYSNPWRWIIAKIISTFRKNKAIEIYKKLGGSSPLLRHTQEQANSLQRHLENKEDVYKVFIAMRYWHPFTEQVIEEVKNFSADEAILLPLYPHYSTTTTGSSFKEWDKQAQLADLNIKTHKICCYFENDLYIQAHVDNILPIYQQAQIYGKPRILFSAHGLPQSVIDKGDPYQWQIEQSVELIVDNLKKTFEGDFIDYTTCYQSRVGPKKWLEPKIDDELKRVAQDQQPVIVVPISFVSEHSETLVELDIDYKKYAEDLKIPFYGRVPTLSCHSLFIQALANQIRDLPANKKSCPDQLSQCYCRIFLISD